MKTNNSSHKSKMDNHNYYNLLIKNSHKYKKSLNKIGIHSLWNGKMLKLISITKYSLNLSIWEMHALPINTSLKAFKLVNIVLHKSFLVIHICITLMYGHWHVLFLNLWPITSSSNLKKLKESPKMRIICIKCWKCWVQWVNSSHLEELKAEHTSTKKVNCHMEIQNNNFQSVSYSSKIMVMIRY